MKIRVQLSEQQTTYFKYMNLYTRHWCTPAYLVMKVRRGCSKHTAVGPEHLTLHLDGEVTQPALLPLAVQIVQNRSTGTGETHLDCQTSRSSWSTAARIHGCTKVKTEALLSAKVINYLWCLCLNTLCSFVVYIMHLFWLFLLLLWLGQAIINNQYW